MKGVILNGATPRRLKAKLMRILMTAPSQRLTCGFLGQMLNSLRASGSFVGRLVHHEVAASVQAPLTDFARRPRSWRRCGAMG